MNDARRVLTWARDGVDSPKETELRLLALRCGFPEPDVQHAVVDRTGRIVARLDLGFATYRAGLEYDGQVHLDRHQHSRDLQRHNLLRDLGWTVLQIDSRLLANPALWVPQLSGLVPRCPTQNSLSDGFPLIQPMWINGKVTKNRS